MKLHFCLISALWMTALGSPAHAQSTIARQCINNLQYQNGQYNNATFSTGIDAESAATLCQEVVDRQQSAAVYTCVNNGLYRNGFYNNPNYRTGLNINEVLELCGNAANTNPAIARERCLVNVKGLGVGDLDGRQLCQQAKTAKQAEGVSRCLKEQLYDVGFYNNPNNRSTISLSEAVRSCTPE
jgi:hypothetical protein